MNGNNQFLVPANTKKGNLIFNIFQPIDLMIFGIGVGSTLLILVILSANDLMNNISSLLALVPGFVAVALVFPFPNYHNIRVAFGELIAFYSNRQKYVWRGWCVRYELKDK